jgi:prevent-host-death family protein
MSVTERMTPTEAKRNLATVLSKVEYGHRSIIVQRHGRDIAAVVPIEFYELSRKLLQGLEDEEDWKAMQEALADSENAVPLDWDPNRYGRTVQDSNRSKSRQRNPPRAAATAKNGARSHQRARH